MEIYDTLRVLLVDKEAFNFFVKTPVVFLHFAAAAYSIITILSLDIKIFLNYHNPVTQELINEIKQSEQTINIALFVLYVTGIFFIIFGTMGNPNYLENDKLLFKIFIVAVLTVNGFLVNLISHNIVAGVPLSKYGLFRNIGMKFVGSVSSISWIFSCFLGIARDWNFKIDFAHLFVVYLYSIITSFIIINFILFFRRKII